MNDTDLRWAFGLGILLGFGWGALMTVIVLAHT